MQQSRFKMHRSASWTLSMRAEEKNDRAGFRSSAAATPGPTMVSPANAILILIAGVLG
jgi:hypothetical protein